MHLVNLGLLVLVLFLLVYYHENFVASYDMMINHAKDPIFVQYNGREKDAAGNDYYDNFLRNQMMNQYSKKSQLEDPGKFNY
jgi:hypothetical protein